MLSTTAQGAHVGEAHQSASKTALYALVAFVSALLVCATYSPTEAPLLVDNQHYFFIAERAASGYPPHVSHFDPKHALSMLLTAGAISLGRQAGVPDVLATRAFSITVTAGCIALVWLLAWRLTERRLVAHLAAASMLTFSDFMFMGVMGARPKVVLVLFVLLVLLSGFHRRPLASGGACGLAFLCWQPAALLLAAVTAPVLFEPRRLRALFTIAAGFAIPVALYHAYFYAHGALGAQIEQTYFYPANFMGGPWPPRWSGMWLHLTWILQVKNGPSWGTVVPAVAFLTLLVGWVALIARPVALGRFFVRRRGWLCFLTALHLVLYFVLWNYQGFPDRFLLLPFLAVLTGVAFAAPTFLARGARTRTAGRVASGVAVFVLIVVLRLDRIDASGTFTLQEQYRLGEHVGRMLADGHTVWAVGCTHLLAFNHVNNYLPYGFFFRGMDRYLRKVHGVRVFRPLRAGVLPEIILVSRGRARHSDHWLEQEYEAVRSRDFGHQGIHVYRLRDLDS